MAKQLDIVIFGATGFTGKYAVIELYNQLKKRNDKVTWAIAGRSKEKLQAIIDDLVLRTGDESVGKTVQIIVADVKNTESLNAMAAKCKLVINTCGPYRFFGEPVVKACVANKTHHVDVSGEPQYMEKMQLLYNDEAKKNNCYIVSACGFDSIPADLGTVFLEEAFSGTVNSVETFLETWMEGSESTKGRARIHFGTWESAIYGLLHANELGPLRRQLYPKRLPQFKPTLKSRPVIHRNPIVNDKWCVPFPGSDRSVVMRSQRYFYDQEKKRPIQMKAYVIMSNIFVLIITTFIAMMFLLLVKFEQGRQLLLKHPKVFSLGFVSHEGPEEEDMNRTKFRLTLRGEGWTDKLMEPSDQFSKPMNKSIVVNVDGVNPGYGATCTMLVLSALTILDDQDKLPESGGVFPPGALFAKTSLIDRLNKNGVKFEVASISIKSKI